MTTTLQQHQAAIDFAVASGGRALRGLVEDGVLTSAQMTSVAVPFAHLAHVAAELVERVRVRERELEQQRAARGRS